MTRNTHNTLGYIVRPRALNFGRWGGESSFFFFFFFLSFFFFFFGTRHEKSFYFILQKIAEELVRK